MTVAEAARVLEIRPDLVYRLCAAGRLGHHRIGLGRGQIRISQSDLDAYLASCHVAPSPASSPGEAPRPKPRRGAEVPDVIGEILARRKARSRDPSDSPRD